MAQSTTGSKRGIRQPVLLLDSDLRSKSPTTIAQSAMRVVAEYLDAAGGPVDSKVHLLPVIWRFVYVLQYLNAQVENGGFHQFFTNSRGIFDKHLREDIEMIDHREYRELLHAAFAKYAGVDYSEQWENIGKSWERFVEDYKEDRFAAEERAYYAMSKSLPEVIGEYIHDHFAEYTTAEGSNPFDLPPATPQAEEQHPFWRRFGWNPLVVALPCAYLWHVSYSRDFPVPQTAGACFVSLWFLLAVADFVTRHKFLDWLYDTDNPEE